jgi:hypothetical protein
MSRGLGRLLRWLWLIIQWHGKPMMFEDIRAVMRKELEVEDGTKLYSSFERSLRRALQRMVSDGGLIAISGGGPADPYRYFMDPLLIAIASKTPEEGHAWLDALAADPGAAEALKSFGAPRTP